MKKATIAIIEDDQTTLKMLQSTLEDLDYDISAFISSAEATTAHIMTANPDLLLVDIYLDDDINGIDIIKQLNKSLAIPVIYITAHNDDTTFNRAKQTNPYGFLIKPVGKNELRTVIETALYRYQMEQKLVESENKYRSLIQASPYGIAEIDPSGSIIFSNQQFDSLFGYNEGTMTGRSLFDLIKNKPEKKEMWSYLNIIFEQHIAPEPVYLKVLTYSGKALDIELVWNYKPDSHGAISGLIIIVTDITERKKTEDELNMFSLAIETTLDPVIIINMEGIITYCNRATEKTFNYKKSELIGQKVSFIDPDPENQSATIIPAIIAEGALTGYVTAKTKHGIIIPFLMSSTLIKNKDDIPIGIMGILNNISKQKHFEEHLQKELAINAALAQMASAILQSDLSLKKICTLILEHAKKTTRSQHGYVSTVDNKSRDMLVHTFTEMIANECHVHDEHKNIKFPIKNDGTYNGLWGHSLNLKMPFFTNSPTTHGTSKGVPEGHIPLNNFLSVPVMIGDALLGQIALANNENDYSEQDISIINRLADFMAISIQRFNFEEELKLANELLERRVEQRTMDLEEANKKLNLEIDERLHMEKALLASEEKFKTVADFTYDWETWINANGDYIYMSPSCERITGYSRDDFMRDPGLLSNIIHPDDKGLFSNHLRDVLRSPRTDFIDFRLITRNGEVIWIGHRCQPVYDSEGKWLGQRGSNREITGRKNAEEALKHSERNSNAILNASKDIIIMLNSSGAIITINDSCARQLAMSRDQIIGKHISNFIPGYFPEEILINFNLIFFSKIIIEFDNEHNKAIYNHQFYPIFDAEQHVDQVALFIRDITQIRKLENEIIRISEEERKKIGQNLHDGLGQDLTALTFLVEKFYKKMLKENQPGSSAILEIQDNIRDAIIKTKDMAKFLSPFNIEQSGLNIALEEMGERIKNVFNISFSIFIKGDVVFDDNQAAQHLYYIAREATNNALRHGKPSKIIIMLEADDSFQTMIIKDNGTGMKKNNRSDGMGLAIMQYRSQIIGGTFSAGNNEDEGFSVKVQLKKK